jgi:hypothetical protein
MKQDCNDCSPAWNQRSDDPGLDNPIHGELPPCGLRTISVSGCNSAPQVVSDSRVSILQKEEVCLAAPASIPRALQLSVQKKQR